jgi:hypothetical protein
MEETDLRFVGLDSTLCRLSIQVCLLAVATVGSGSALKLPVFSVDLMPSEFGSMNICLGVEGKLSMIDRLTIC